MSGLTGDAVCNCPFRDGHFVISRETFEKRDEERYKISRTEVMERQDTLVPREMTVCS